MDASNHPIERLQRVVGDVMTSTETMRHMHHLCDLIGPRPAGSTAEAMTRDYLLDRFRSYGLANVTSEAFPAPHWRRGSTRASIVVPTQRSIELLALPKNRTHQLRAEVASASFRTIAEFDRVASSLRGKIVLIYGEAVTGAGPGVLHRAERVRLANEAGAAAFLWASNWRGRVLPTGSMDGEIAKRMPAFGITLEDAGLIERLLTNQGRVVLDITTDNETSVGTSWNVWGDINSAQDAPMVLVTAHYDSHDITDGAFDNAAGCAIVLECARTLAHLRSSIGCNVRFLIFSAEEVGLHGSKQYALRHADELPRIRFMINADGLGVMPATKYVHVPLHTGAARYLRDVFAHYGFDVYVDNALNLNWDHAPFAVRGVPTGSITARWAPGTQVHFGHTAADTLDKVDASELRSIVAATVTAVWHIANDDDPSLTHLTPDAVDSALAAAGKQHMLAQFVDVDPADGG